MKIAPWAIFISGQRADCPSVVRCQLSVAKSNYASEMTSSEEGDFLPIDEI
jgi:hypothetical protein